MFAELNFFYTITRLDVATWVSFVRGVIKLIGLNGKKESNIGMIPTFMDGMLSVPALSEAPAESGWPFLFAHDRTASGCPGTQQRMLAGFPSSTVCSGGSTSGLRSDRNMVHFGNIILEMKLRWENFVKHCITDYEMCNWTKCSSILYLMCSMEMKRS